MSLTGHIRARTEESLAFRIDGRMIARKVDVGAGYQARRSSSPNSIRSRSRTLCVPRKPHLPRRRPPSMKPPTIWSVSGHWLARVGPPGSSSMPRRRRFSAPKRRSLPSAAQLHDAEDQLGYAKLLADAPGAVIPSGAEAGEVVRAGQMIATVAHNDGADAVFDIPATLFRQVSPDALIGIALTDDPTVHTVGQVREVAPQADPVTNSYRVKVGLTDWPQAMRLGATVTGQTRMVAPGGIELPATALTMVENQVGRLGGRSRNSACVAATGGAATPGTLQHRRNARA